MLNAESVDSLISQWSNVKLARDVFGMGPTESAAVINLMTAIPPTAVEVLKRCAARFGMVRGAFSHAALAQKAMCVGFVPDTPSPEWQRRMVNTEETVQLLVARLVSDYEAMPANMRKPAGPDQVVSLQKVVASFLVVKDEFMATVSAENAAKEWSGIHAAFMVGGMDLAVASMAEEGMWPVDLSLIPEFKSILVKLETDLEQKQVARNQELRQQVQSATYRQLMEELGIDAGKLEAYFDRLMQVRGNWQNVVVAHKRRRYQTGLMRVRSLMGSQLEVRVSDVASAHIETNAFRKQFVDHCLVREPWPGYVYDMASA